MNNDAYTVAIAFDFCPGGLQRERLYRKYERPADRGQFYSPGSRAAGFDPYGHGFRRAERNRTQSGHANPTGFTGSDRNTG